MFQPTFRAILCRFPDANISIVAAQNSPVIEILSRAATAEGRIIQRVFEADYKKLSNFERRSLNNEIVRSNFDMVFCTYMSPIPYFAKAIRSIPYRIGHVIRENWYKPRPNNIFNIRIPLDQDHTHETERHAKLAVAVQAHTPTDTSSTLYLTNEEIAWADQFIEEQGLGDKRLIGTHFGASKLQNWKRWSESGFDRTLQAITQANDRFFLFGLSDERDGILACVQSVSDQCIDLIGKLTIFQVAALLQRCEFTIANDSGIGHVSMAVGTKTVRVFGMSDYWGYRSLAFPDRDIFLGISCSPCLQLGYLKPYNVHNCGHRNCMNLVTPEQVVETIRRV